MSVHRRTDVDVQMYARCKRGFRSERPENFMNIVTLLSYNTNLKLSNRVVMALAQNPVEEAVPAIFFFEVSREQLIHICQLCSVCSENILLQDQLHN